MKELTDIQRLLAPIVVLGIIYSIDIIIEMILGITDITKGIVSILTFVISVYCVWKIIKKW